MPHIKAVSAIGGSAYAEGADAPGENADSRLFKLNLQLSVALGEFVEAASRIDAGDATLPARVAEVEAETRVCDIARQIREERPLSKQGLAVKIRAAAWDAGFTQVFDGTRPEDLGFAALAMFWLVREAEATINAAQKRRKSRHSAASLPSGTWWIQP